MPYAVQRDHRRTRDGYLLLSAAVAISVWCWWGAVDLSDVSLTNLSTAAQMSLDFSAAPYTIAACIAAIGFVTLWNSFRIVQLDALGTGVESGVSADGRLRAGA